MNRKAEAMPLLRPLSKFLTKMSSTCGSSEGGRRPHRVSLRSPPLANAFHRVAFTRLLAMSTSMGTIFQFDVPSFSATRLTHMNEVGPPSARVGHCAQRSRPH